MAAGLPRFAEIAEHGARPREIIRARIETRSCHNGKSGRSCGNHAVFRVFERDAIGCSDAKTVKNEMINVGRRFFHGYTVAGADDLEPGGAVHAEGCAQESVDIVGARGRGNRYPQSYSTGLSAFFVIT